MPGDDLKLNLRLTADGKGFVGELRMSKRELDKLTGGTERAAEATSKAAEATSKATAETSKATAETSKATAETSKATAETSRGATATRSATAATRKGAAATRSAAAEKRNATAAARKLEQATQEQARAFRQSESAARNSGGAIRAAHRHALRYVGAYFGAQGIAAASRGLVRHADAYTQINNAVRLATDGGANHAAIQQEIFDIAHRTRAPVAELSDLFQKLTISSADLGASNEQFLRVLEGVGQALVINGTSAQQARGALLQFSQAMSSNIVRAEEFNSILEGAKPILIAVANNLDAAGGSVGRLRKLVIEGQVSSREFFEAFERGLPELEETFKRANSTIGQGLTQVDNALTQLVGRMDESSGASHALAGALETVAESLADVDAEGLANALAPVVAGVSVLAAAMIGAGATALTAYGLKMGATRVQTQWFALMATKAAARTDVLRFAKKRGAATARRYAAAINSASTAVRGLGRGLALLTGPAGWAALTAYSIYEVVRATRDAGDVAEEYARIQEQIKAGQSGAPGGGKSSERELVDFAEARLKRARDELELIQAGNANVVIDSVREENEKPFRERVARAEAVLREAQARLERAASLKLNDIPPAAAEPAAAPATDPSAAETAFRRLQRSHLNERAAIAANYREKRKIIAAAEKSEAVTDEEITEQKKRALAARNQAIHKLYMDGQAAIARARAAAEQKRKEQEEQADAARTASGIPALETFRSRQKELAGATDLSAVALERQAAKTRITAEVLDEYKDADKAVQLQLINTRLAIEQHEAALGRQAEAYQRITGNAAAYAQQLRDLNAAERLAIDNAANSSAKPGEIEARQADIAANAKIERERLYTEQYLAENRNRWDQELLAAEGYRSRIEQAEDQHQKNLLATKLQGQPALAAIAQKHSKTILALDRGEEASAKQKFTLGLDLAQEGFSQAARYSKKAFKLNQAASIAQAIINAYEGISKALSAFPPPFNFIAAAAVGAAGFAQVAAIRAQQPPQGYVAGRLEWERGGLGGFRGEGQ